ncbi:hypothetical protein [Flavihumibacter sp. UBA7668]|uniref:hypothetical protein n=1 Tax=Flavihumibacter sp. UBA7668 TaxID=1946542 RepID=UPI0025B8C47A|nr:hypothetical protein [Flavihumibacter sp. UBA7668]
MIQIDSTGYRQSGIFAKELLLMIATILPVIHLSLLCPIPNPVGTLAAPAIFPYKDSFYLSGSTSDNF